MLTIILAAQFLCVCLGSPIADSVHRRATAGQDNSGGLTTGDIIAIVFGRVELVSAIKCLYELCRFLQRKFSLRESPVPSSNQDADLEFGSFNHSNLHAIANP